MSTATTILETFASNLYRYKCIDSAKVNDSVSEEFSLQEVADHDNIFDCWIIVYDRIYDITKFLNQHPGGVDILLEYAGRDATLAFRSTGHSTLATKTLEQFYIGNLPLHQRIFRKPGGFALSNMPE